MIFLKACRLPNHNPIFKILKNIPFSIKTSELETTAMARTRPLIVELDEGENLYICRNCYTHIGYAGLLTHIDISPQGSGLTGDKFQEVVNVRGHSRTRRDVGIYTIKDVHCRNCIDHLGWEFVEIRGGRLHHNLFGIYPGEYLMIPYRLAILIDDSPESMQPGQVRQ